MSGYERKADIPWCDLGRLLIAKGTDMRVVPTLNDLGAPDWQLLYVGISLLLDKLEQRV